MGEVVKIVINGEELEIPGSTSEDGATFTPAVSQAGVISWSNDKGKENPKEVDLVAAVLAALPDGDEVSY